MKNNLSAGSHPAGLTIQAAAAYAEGVGRQYALGNALFDKFSAYLKDKRNEKREDALDRQKDETHTLQKDALSKQNQILQKNLNHYDSDKAAEKARFKAQNAAAYASALVHQEQGKALKAQRKEKEDFDALAKRLAPFITSVTQGATQTLNDDTISAALKFSDENLTPSRP